MLQFVLPGVLCLATFFFSRKTIMTYFDELKRTMEWLAHQPRTIFVGQTVAGPGHSCIKHCVIFLRKRPLEMPINESFQMQFSLGLALAGHVPISVYPRQNFLLLATSDMVNMVDKVPANSSRNSWPCRMLIRVAAGPYEPIHPGHQHIGNYAEGLQKMFTAIEVRELLEPEDVFPAYEEAYARDGITLLIEHRQFLFAEIIGSASAQINLPMGGSMKILVTGGAGYPWIDYGPASSSRRSSGNGVG